LDTGSFPGSMFPHGRWGNTVDAAENLLRVLYPDDYKDQTIYVVPRRFAKQLGPNWKRLDEVFAERVKEIFADITQEELKQAEKASESLVSSTMSNWARTAVVAAIKDGSIASPLLSSYWAKSKATALEFEELNDRRRLISAFFRFATKEFLTGASLPPHPIDDLYAEVRDQYPLLFRVNQEVTKDEIVEYIRAIDAYKSQNPVQANAQIADDQDQDPMNFCAAI
jgi:hypothetical protein